MPAFLQAAQELSGRERKSELETQELLRLSLRAVFGHSKAHPEEAEFGRRRLVSQSWVVKGSGSL